FNEPIDDWLSFFMFTTFTDRDGKFQLLSLAESAFDPLSRTCRFMLTEEAHHMFVGQAGIGRIVERTAELVRQGKDPRQHGAFPFDLIQRYLNFWYAASLDLFGAEVSTNGATYFSAGLEARPKEERYPDHRLLEGAERVELLEGGRIVEREVAPRLAVNLHTRAAYSEDCRGAVARWNKVVADLGVAFRLPSERVHRAGGTFSGACFAPDGRPLTPEEFERGEFLPSPADRAYVRSLMTRPVTGPGQFAGWISPPKRGIDSRPIDFEYVRLNEA